VLDQIAQDFGSAVAPVEWHVGSGYPLYCAEAHSKWYMYPPPYGGSYATPWLWMDGKSRGYNYNEWSGFVAAQIRLPAEVSLFHVGTTYDPGTRTGEVRVECYNSGADTLDAALQIAVTEDSLKYNAPNGDTMHNHTCRDYVPDQNGTPIMLAPGATDTLIVPYAVDPSWVEENLNLVIYLQNMTVQTDSSMPCYQGVSGGLLQLTGVKESKLSVARDLRVSVSPNPCRTGCEFTLSGAAARGARLAVYSPDGRLVSNVEMNGNRASWHRNGVSRGIYMYRVVSGTAFAQGKLVVID